MLENETSPVPKNQTDGPPSRPYSEPDSFFKLLYRYLIILPPAVRWGVLIVVLASFIILTIWKLIPISKQEQFIDYIISEPKPEPPDPSVETQEPKVTRPVEEFRARNLLTKIKDARNYLEGGGSPANKEKALRIYQDVLAQLSSEATRELDQDLLARANSDARAGYIDDALSKYKAMFDKVLAEN